MYNWVMGNESKKSRKKNRLKDFDYSSNASYFLTICSDRRKEIFSKIVYDETVGANIVRPSAIGKIIEIDILKIENIYPCVFVDNYVIMPNHIHLILTIDTIRRPMVAPTIATVIKQFKGAVSKETGTTVWQKGFYDHIIRDDEDYNTKAQYIGTNPLTWERDELYTER